MNRKPSGFWKRSQVLVELERFVDQAISLDEAAARIQAMCEKEGVSQSLEELRADVKWYSRDVRRNRGLLPPAKAESVTVRLGPVALQAFKDLARRTSRSLGSVVSEAAEEAVRMRQHPGIVFAGPPGNRRARLESGPDVWEVAAFFKMAGEDMTRTQEMLNHLTPGQVEAALRYYRTQRNEIDGLIAENERPIEEWQRLYPHLIPVSRTPR
ncbi:MAG: hypothetical protein ACRDFW_08980 [bacterium]